MDLFNQNNHFAFHLQSSIIMSETLTQPKTELKVSTVAELFKSKNIVSLVPKIRTNAKEYPYITVIDGANKAENIYFSKEASKQVAEGEPVGKGFFDKYQVGYTTNEAGEPRIKFISNSERVAIDAIL